MGFGREAFSTGLRVGVVIEEMRHMRTEHAAAGARGDDDVVISLECIEELAGDRRGCGAVAGIIGGLPAAGLATRHLDIAAGGFEQLDGSKAHARPVEIHEAGDEQGDAGAWGGLFHGCDLRGGDGFRQSLASRMRPDGTAFHSLSRCCAITT